MADLGATTYTAVTWTSGDVITEAKLDNMVANDQAYDSHASQGLLLNNNKALAVKNAGGTNKNLLKLSSGDDVIVGESDLSEFNFFELASDPSNAPSGMRRLFAKADGMYEKDDAGNQIELGKRISCAFSVYNASTQSITQFTNTEVNFDTEYFDQGGVFDTAGHRFTAPSDGLYYITAGVECTSGSGDQHILKLYKNGSEILSLSRISGGGANQRPSGSTILNLSASDYIEIYYYIASAGTKTIQANGFFAGYKIGELG
jgi:hypothetical protein